MTNPENKTKTLVSPKANEFKPPQQLSQRLKEVKELIKEKMEIHKSDKEKLSYKMEGTKHKVESSVDKLRLMMIKNGISK